MPNFLIDEDTGVLAAEFVLGTLDSAERANAHSLLKADHGFIAMVRIWERRFGDLHLMVEPVDPDTKIFERIKAKLPVTVVEAATVPPDPQKAAAAPASSEPPTPAVAAPDPPPVSAAVTAEASKPPESSPETEAPKPPAAAPASETTIAPAPTLPPAADLAPPRPPEEKPKTERAPIAKGAPLPPPLPPPSLKAPDKAPDRFQDRRAERRSEVTIDVIRSRRRWRAFGVFMILVLCAMGGLVAAWRVMPDRLPPQLRPSAVMMVIGLQADPTTPPAPERKPAPPESQFDE